MTGGFALTRELAYAMATDAAHRSMDPFQLRPWTDAAQDVYIETFRRVWTLDDEFTQQEFEAVHGHAPRPTSDRDLRECRQIWERRKAAGLVYGAIPHEG